MNLEFNLVKFPLIFPLIYGAILYSFPNYEIYLIFFTILILAETHFGATWPFFINKSNINLIKENKITLISIPLLICIFSIFGFIFFKSFFFLIFFAANIYHVTRQSFGISKLYTKNSKELKFQEILIYTINLFFFLIGFFRFYYPLIGAESLIFLNLFVIIFFVLILLFYLKKFHISDSFFTFLTGLIIFYPICFVNNPVHAIIMGVTMHYTQYIYLTYKVQLGRIKENSSKNSKAYYFSIILIYTLVMTSLSLLGKSNQEVFSQLIIIPIIGQMLHFYLDSQLWKFSEKHNRDNTLKFLK